jgi:hypothetical protein
MLHRVVINPITIRSRRPPNLSEDSTYMYMSVGTSVVPLAMPETLYTIYNFSYMLVEYLP